MQRVADIDTKRITSVSDGENAMPVYWGVAAKDIKYNNAIIMATVIARRIDKQNLWDGLLHFKEKTKRFNIHPFSKINTFTFIDTMQTDVKNPISQSFTEDFGTVNIKPFLPISVLPFKEEFPTPTAARLPFTAIPLYSINKSDTSIYIELRNPISIGNGTIEGNIAAFQVLVTVGTTTYYPKITNLSLDVGKHVIWLDLDSDIMNQSTQVITVIYDADIGTIEDSINTGKISGFQTSFNYASNETE